MTDQNDTPVVRVDGATADGTRVRVVWEDSPYEADVWIDGEPAPLTGAPRHAVRVFRDGGTIEISTVHGTVRFPRRINDPDRTPRLNGKPIT
jgi:uncharacterized protein YqiB (DUF1249 family)